MSPVSTTTGTRLNVPLPADLLPPVAESREQAIGRIEASLHDYLRASAQDLAGIDVTTHVAFAGDVAKAIVGRARETRPDLIAMATHGRTGLNHALAGSVCEAVIRSGVAPVLVLRP